MLDHEGAHLLPVDPRHLGRCCSGANEIGHRLVNFERPYRRSFAGQPANETAARHFVLAGSPGFLVITDGATTVHSWPSDRAIASQAGVVTDMDAVRRDGISQLGDMDLAKHFPSTGSSSCDRGRLGSPEQPSDAQCRASHLTGRGERTYRLMNKKRATPKEWPSKSGRKRPIWDLKHSDFSCLVF